MKLNPTRLILKTVIPGLVLFADNSRLYSQLPVSKYEMGILGGFIIYQGDLTPTNTGSYKTMKPAFAIYGSRILSNSFAVRLNLAFEALPYRWHWVFFSENKTRLEQF